MESQKKNSDWKAMIRENYQVYSEVEQKSNQEFSSRLSRENQGENLLYNKEDGTINRSKVVSFALTKG